MLIHFDEDGYDMAKRWAMDKVANYGKAKKYAEKYIDVNDAEAFSNSFTGYFKDAFLKKNRSKIQLDISVDKLMDLLEVDITPLAQMEYRYKENDSTLAFDAPDGIPAPVLDKSKFEMYTNSSDQNEVLRDARRLIKAVEKASRHTHFFPADIARGTNNSIGYDIRRGVYFVNPRIFW